MNKSMLLGAVASGRRRGGLTPGVHTMTATSSITDWNVNLPYLEDSKLRTAAPSGVPTLLEFRGTVVIDVKVDGGYSVVGGAMQLVGYMPIDFKGSAVVLWFWDGATSTLTIPGWAAPTQTLPANARGIPTGPPASNGPRFNQGFFAIATGSLPEPNTADLSDPGTTIFGDAGRLLESIPIAGVPLSGGALQPNGTISVPLHGVPPGDLNNHPTKGCTDAAMTSNFLGFGWAFYLSGTITLTKQ